MTSRRVLVVDDHDLVRKAIARELRSGGFTVVEAGSVGEALTLLEAHAEFCAVVTDYQIAPDGNGIELLIEVARRWPEHARVLVSAMPPPRAALPDCVQTCLEKPWCRGELLAAVLALL
jgi:CheY-like chemotaxis protein